MRNLVMIAGVCALAACTPADEADAVDADAAGDTAVAETAGPVAADGLPTPGMYRVTDGDGVVYMENVKADGTYETTKDGELYQTGRWEQPSADQYCSAVDEAYINDENDGTMGCNTEQIGEDGVWTSVGDDGDSVTVERVEG